MPEIELIIKGTSEPYVKSAREAQQATQQMHNTVEKGHKREKGLIEDIEEELKKMQEARRKAYRIEDIEKYNKKIAEATKDLQEYNKIGITAEKQTQSLSKTIGKWALSLGGAAAALKILKDAFLQTVQGMNLFNSAGAVTSQVLNDIVSGAGMSISKMRDAIIAQKELNDLRLRSYAEGVEVAKLNREYQELYAKAIDQTLSKTEQLETIDAALEKHNQAITVQMRNVADEYDIVKKKLELQPTNEKVIKQYYALITELNNLDAQRDSETKRLQSLRSGIIANQEREFWDSIHNGLQKAADEENAIIEEANRKRLQQQEDFQKLSLKLIDDYDKMVIDSLEGVDKLRAERAYSLKQLDAFRAQLKELGTLTTEQEEMFRKLGEDVQKIFLEGLKEEVPTVDTKNLFSDLVDKMIPKEGLQQDIIPQKDELTSIWQILGIDPDSDKGKEQMDAIQEAADTVKGVIDDVFDKRVENSRRERELLDNQIQETQNALELEVALMQEGYANNVAAKQKELEELKKQRATALVEEEKALRAQQTMDRISQGVALTSSVANILKSFTKLGPIGLGLAAVAIGTLYTIFATAKAKAAQVTTMAKGGSGDRYGLVSGKLHSQGGEKFLDHVEVERGEAFGVLSREATSKYGNVFHKMVASFNKDQMPEFIPQPVSNSVTVENNGPNTRLDRLIGEQRRLNEQMNGMTRVSAAGTKRIIQRGKNLRIIG